tara:strand:- start:120 stop:275 length:156 start_codon:yes stop_codon:yes gene_type:complete
MTDKRHHCTVTMTDDLFHLVKAAAKAADQPLTVWCREAIKIKLNQTRKHDT